MIFFFCTNNILCFLNRLQRAVRKIGDCFGRIARAIRRNDTIFRTGPWCRKSDVAGAVSTAYQNLVWAAIERLANGWTLATFSSKSSEIFASRCMSSLEPFLSLFILVLNKTFGSLVLFCSKHIWLLNALMLNWYHLNISIWNNMELTTTANVSKQAKQQLCTCVLTLFTFPCRPPAKH